jgi:hypothetical protein
MEEADLNRDPRRKGPVERKGSHGHIFAAAAAETAATAASGGRGGPQCHEIIIFCFETFFIIMCFDSPMIRSNLVEMVTLDSLWMAEKWLAPLRALHAVARV